MKYSFISDRADREINEDSVRVAEKDGNVCIVVADGLGGHGRGEEASALVADEMVNCFKNVPNIKCLDEAFDIAQKKLLDEQKAKRATFEMKTTAVMLVVEASGKARWGHVGDSRLYHLKRGRIKERTIDHSVPQMLVLAKDIKEKEIRFHPDRNKLLKVMGIAWTGSAYTLSEEIMVGSHDAFLLCSDGFWELIDEKMMQKSFKQSDSTENWLKNMETVVCANGADKDMDNYTAAAMWID